MLLNVGIDDRFDQIHHQCLTNILAREPIANTRKTKAKHQSKNPLLVQNIWPQPTQEGKQWVELKTPWFLRVVQKLSKQFSVKDRRVMPMILLTLEERI